MFTAKTPRGQRVLVSRRRTLTRTAALAAAPSSFGDSLFERYFRDRESLDRLGA